MKRGGAWIGIVVALLGFSVATQAVLIWSALDDPSFAVEPDYERKARDWDLLSAERQRSRELGWTTSLSPRAVVSGQVDVTFEAFDRHGKPVREATVNVETFHIARASTIFRARLIATGDGVYGARMPLSRPGTWEFRLRVQSGDDIYTETLRKSVITGTGR